MRNGYYEDLYDLIMEEIAKRVEEATTEDGEIKVELEGHKFKVKWNLNIEIEEADQGDR